GASRERVADLGQMLDEIRLTHRVEPEQPIANTFAVREDVMRQRNAARICRLHSRCTELQRREARAVVESHGDLQSLIPDQRSAARVGLSERQTGNRAISCLQLRRDRWPARL